MTYASQVQDVLIPYTTREDSFNYYEERNYVNDVNREHTEVLQTYDREFKARETYTYGHGRASYLNNETGDHYQYLTNQAAMMKKTVPDYSYNDGVTVPLVGNIRTDVGNPHYNAHAAMEDFYDQYRRGGDKFGDIPTVGDYNVAMKDSLSRAGIPSQQVDNIISAVKAEQRYYGLTDKSDIVIPGRISLPRK